MSIDGKFWLEDDSEHSVPGRLTLSTKWPTVDLAGTLTPFGRPPNGSFTVHGSVDKIGSVSLLDAYVANEVFGSAGERQTIRARYALTSPGIEISPDDTYVGVQLELAGLERWTGQDGLDFEFSGDRVKAVAYALPNAEVPLENGAGSITLGTSFGKTGGSGPISLTVWRKRAYLVTGLEPRTLDQIGTDFIDPLRTVTRLCTDSECDIRTVSVAPSDMPKRWLRVHGPRVWGNPESEEGAFSDGFIEYESIGLQGIAKWLSISHTLGPLGAVVTSGRHSTDLDLATMVFQLASAAEGLHRRAYDDFARIDKNTARIVRRATKRIFTRFGQDVSSAISDGLAFLSQPSYAMRLHRIVAEMAEVDSDAFGSTPGQWVKKVKAARNQMAHQLHDVDTLPEEQQIVLAQSLYWILTTLMLRQAGVTSQDLSEALKGNRSFGSFLAQGRAWMPDVYGQDS